MVTGELYREFMRGLEDIKRVPLKETATINIPGQRQGSAIIQVPKGWRFYIKSWRIVRGNRIQVISIRIDGYDTYQTGDFMRDTVPEYGDLLIADEKIEVLGKNTGNSPQQLSIGIKGFRDEVNK